MVIAVFYHSYTTYYAAKVATPVIPGAKMAIPTCKGCFGVVGWCTPDKRYYYCYDYSYKDAYAKVQLTELLVKDNSFIRGLTARWKITGSGTVHGYWWPEVPSCNVYGCNAIDIGTYGYVVFGVYDVYIPGVSTKYEKDIYLNEEAGVRLKDTGILTLWKTQKGYYWIGHSKPDNYAVYAYIGFKGYKIKSAITPERIYTFPSQPVAGKPFKVILDLYNYCEYDASQKMKVIIYDDKGNQIDSTNWFEVWVDGKDWYTYQTPNYFTVSKEGKYRIVVEIVNGEAYSKDINVITKLPSATITIENVIGYAAASALMVMGIILIIRMLS